MVYSIFNAFLVIIVDVDCVNADFYSMKKDVILFFTFVSVESILTISYDLYFVFLWYVRVDEDLLLFFVFVLLVLQL